MRCLLLLALLLLAGCSSGSSSHGGFGNITIHIVRHGAHRDGGRASGE